MRKHTMLLSKTYRTNLTGPAKIRDGPLIILHPHEGVSPSASNPRHDNGPHCVSEP
jgi:hypothetical protein